MFLYKNLCVYLSLISQVFWDFFRCYLLKYIFLSFLVFPLLTSASLYRMLLQTVNFCSLMIISCMSVYKLRPKRKHAKAIIECCWKFTSFCENDFWRKIYFVRRFRNSLLLLSRGYKNVLLHDQKKNWIVEKFIMICYDNAISLT